MTLNLLTFEPISAVVPSRPEKSYSPPLALFLSFVFPGLGYLYLRAWRQAAWIMGLELLSLAVVVAGTGQLHGTAIIAAPSLYLFAIIDAYFRAREWNAGVTSWMIGANPRVTAILNLLTKGFGYFYLGDRAKGVVCFVVMSATQAILLLHTNVWTQILAISLQVAVALDGYRVARERLFQNHPELRSLQLADADVSQSVIDAANPGGSTPKLAMAFFAIFGVSMLIAYGSLLALNGHTVTSIGTLEDGPAGLTYRNSHVGIELTVPEGWTPFSSKNTVASLRDDGVSIVIQEQFATYPVESMLNQTENEVRKLHPTAAFKPMTTNFAGRSVSGFEVSYNNGAGLLVHQRVFGLRRGIKILVWIESWSLPAKREILNKIRGTIHLR
jgi:hypothetical protein